jgi:hypothetical protein
MDNLVRKIETATKNKIIGYSLEQLYHFHCDSCGGWWSIGDWVKTEKINCPHCLVRGVTQELPPFNMDN